MLLLQDAEVYSDKAIFLREFDTVAQEVQENLKISSFVAEDFGEDVWLGPVELQLKLDILLISLEDENLECLTNDLHQIKFFLNQFKSSLFKFGLI